MSFEISDMAIEKMIADGRLFFNLRRVILNVGAASGVAWCPDGFGILRHCVALERAVALGHRWAYLGLLSGGLGGPWR